MIPEGAKKFEKKTEGVPDASKKGTRELLRPKMRPAKSRDGLQKGPWDPRGAPEAPGAQITPTRKRNTVTELIFSVISL